MNNQQIIVPTAQAPAPVGQPFKVANIGAGQSRSELSGQWASRPADQRFVSLSALRDHCQRAFDNSRAQAYDSRDVQIVAPEAETMEDTRKLTVHFPDGDFATPNHWSFGQIAGLVGAPAAYLRTLPSQLVADNLQYGLAVGRSEMVKSYVRQDGAHELRAVTGPDYGRIPDAEVVRAIQRVAGEGDGSGGYPWKVPGVMDWGSLMYNPLVPISQATTTLFASDRDMFVFLVDDLHPIVVGKTKAGDDDIMFRGFYVWNSETGSKSMGIATMYLRSICCNRILWGVENFDQIIMRHSKNAPARFMDEAIPALAQYAEGSVQKLTLGVQAAQAAIVADDDEAAMAFLKGR